MPEIELQGGEHDGTRITVPDPAPYRYCAMPRPVVTLASLVREGEMPPWPPPPLMYERAGIRDDGTVWYRLLG